MFTGIVEETGVVRSARPRDGGVTFEIGAAVVLTDVELGASIAVNGCCLTVTAFAADSFSCDAVIETLARTNLGRLRPGDRVNLERPLRVGDRLGGHLVQGHIDATGTVRSRDPQTDGSVLIGFAAPVEIMRYIVHKGSVTVDGISLTVAAVAVDGFTVAVIPHTLAVTTLGRRAEGDPVNLEADTVAKYVERLLPDRSEQ